MSRCRTITFVAFSVQFFLCAAAFAAESTFSQSICNIAAQFTHLADLAAILLLISFGIQLSLGRGTWGQALLHLTGAAVIMGAAGIVDSMVPAASAGCV